MIAIRSARRLPHPPSPPLPTPVSLHLNSLFPRCTTTALLRQLHAQLLHHNLLRNTLLASRLVSFYLAASAPVPALHLFDQIPHKTPRAWNTLLSHFSNQLPPAHFIRLYRLARADSIRPDTYSIVFALTAFPHGNAIHTEAVKSGLDIHPHVITALVVMYLDLHCLADAEKVVAPTSTEDSAGWSLLMKYYLQSCMCTRVFELYERMKVVGVELDTRGAICLTRACGGREGQAIHGLVIKKNWLEGNVYLQTAILDMYGKAGFADYARWVFDDMPVKDVVAWSAVIACLAKSGKACEALMRFRSMLEVAVMPNGVTLASVLLAIVQLGALQQGKSVHGFIVRNAVALDVVTYTSLLDMYAKCGSVDSAYKVFEAMPVRNVFSWSAMIGGFGMHGMCSRVLEVFDRTRSENVEPNEVTFVSVLSACSHSGKVEEGREYFKLMRKEYMISPTIEHYSCMVDLLGRAGLIDEAESLVREMPMEPNASVWGALLGACRFHKKVELAQEVVKKLNILETDRASEDIAIANIYAAAEMWDMVKKRREGLNEIGLRRTVGFSTIEVNKRVYIFYSINKLGAKNTDIAELWQTLSNQMQGLGYTPDLSFMCDVDEEQEEMHCGHSEKLALAFGLLKTNDVHGVRPFKGRTAVHLPRSSIVPDGGMKVFSPESLKTRPIS